MSFLKGFGRFWWDFIVGDDWLIAAGLVLAVGVTWLLAHDGVNAWWLLPVAVGFLLAGSLWRVARRT
jgi:hypothetical protein